MSGDEDEEAAFEFEHDDLNYVSTIGEGATSTVYLAKLAQPVFRGQTTVAVKEIKGQIDTPTLQAVQRELFVLSRVSHPHILRFIGMVSNRLPVCLILEYCAGGSLFELLHNCGRVDLSWHQKLKVIHDTASALDYLHTFDPPILHRDLKSLNLMLLDEVKDAVSLPEIKLADFGFARAYEDSSMTQCVGTKHWMAPEVMNSTQYTGKADIFSFAMVTYEVVRRLVPFEELDPSDVARALSKGQRPRFDEWPSEAPTDLKQLVEMCWAHDPQLRPESGQVVDLVAKLLEPYQDGRRVTL